MMHWARRVLQTVLLEHLSASDVGAHALILHGEPRLFLEVAFRSSFVSDLVSGLQPQHEDLGWVGNRDCEEGGEMRDICDTTKIRNRFKQRKGIVSLKQEHEVQKEKKKKNYKVTGLPRE